MLRATNSNASVSCIPKLFIFILTISDHRLVFLLSPVNEKAVATDEVYYATENGQIFDCDYKNMNMFRKGTLYDLLSQVPSTIGRMSRPNNIVEKYR